MRRRDKTKGRWKLRELSVVLHGDQEKLAPILVDMLTQTVPTLSLSELSWRRLLIALYYDPDRDSFRTLLEEFGVLHALSVVVQRDGAITFAIPGGTLVALRYEEKYRLQLDVDFGRSRTDLVCCALAAMIRHGVGGVDGLMVQMAQAILAEEAAIA